MALNRESRGERTPPSPPLLAVTITPRVASTTHTFRGSLGFKPAKLSTSRRPVKFAINILPQILGPKNPEVQVV